LHLFGGTRHVFDEVELLTFKLPKLKVNLLRSINAIALYHIIFTGMYRTNALENVLNCM
jgi:hypothetical protein